MAATERITMTMRELDRFKVIQDVADGRLKPWRAADQLGLSERQVSRLRRRSRCSTDQSRALNVFLPETFKQLMPAMIPPRHPG